MVYHILLCLHHVLSCYYFYLLYRSHQITWFAPFVELKASCNVVVAWVQFWRFKLWCSFWWNSNQDCCFGGHRGWTWTRPQVKVAKQLPDFKHVFLSLGRDGEMQDVSRRHATVPGPPSLPVSSKRHGSWPRWFTLPNILACSSFARCFLWRYTRHVPTSTSRTNMTIIWCQYSRYWYIFIPKHHVKCFAWWIDLELMVQSCTSDVPKPPQVISRLSSLMGWTSNLKLVSQIGEWQPSISTQMCLGRCCFHLSASTTSTTICRSWLGFEGSCSGLGLAVCETGSNNGHYKKYIILTFLCQSWDQPKLTSMFGTMMLVSLASLALLILPMDMYG